MEHGLLKHLCFLFASVSPCRACVCMYVCACVSYVCVCVCVCVCVWPRADTEMKVTGEEVPSNHKRRHEAFPV